MLYSISKWNLPYFSKGRTILSFADWLLSYWMYIILGLSLAFLPYVSKISSYYSTLIHEIGHGVSSLNPVGGLGGISLSPDSSGENRVSYKGGLLFIPIRIGSLMAGYAAPIYAGLFFLVTTVFNLGDVFKWVISIICILTLLAIRNLFGALIIIIHAAFWGCIVFLDILPLYPVLVSLGVILLARGIHDYIQVAGYSFISRHKGLGTDFDLLQQEFFLPRQVWFVVFTVFHTTVLFFALSILITMNIYSS